MDEMITQFASLGVIGVGFAYLFKNTLDEKKEDRQMYTKTVEKFTEVISTQGEAMKIMNVRMENVENGVERIESAINKKGE